MTNVTIHDLDTTEITVECDDLTEKQVNVIVGRVLNEREGETTTREPTGPSIGDSPTQLTELEAEIEDAIEAEIAQPHEPESYALVAHRTNIQINYE